ncbi:MAG: hypothetical protein IE909_12190 [Campylobacterales bacterium]|nr:hypothetical protein [Campylobacterales bacterium]
MNENNITYEIQEDIITFFIDGVRVTSVKTDNIEQTINDFITSMTAPQVNIEDDLFLFIENNE